MLASLHKQQTSLPPLRHPLRPMLVELTHKKLQILLAETKEIPQLASLVQGKEAYRRGWRISETQEPQWRWRTPRYLCGLPMATVVFSLLLLLLH